MTGLRPANARVSVF